MGAVVYEKPLLIPRSERIPALASTQEGRYAVLTALTASIGGAMGHMNLKYSMNADQILEIGNLIIDQASEDWLAIEDVLLFLQELLLGRMGKIYDRIDIPFFFELFETYRQKRYEALRKFRDEEQSQHKIQGAGSLPRMGGEGIDAATMLSMMETLYSEDNDSGTSAE